MNTGDLLTELMRLLEKHGLIKPEVQYQFELDVAPSRVRIEIKQEEEGVKQ